MQPEGALRAQSLFALPVALLTVYVARVRQEATGCWRTPLRSDDARAGEAERPRQVRRLRISARTSVAGCARAGSILSCLCLCWTHFALLLCLLGSMSIGMTDWASTAIESSSETRLEVTERVFC